MSTPAIAQYAAIGDGRSVALVSREGSIDWLCWPRLDSPSLFARILDEREGGFFRVGPRSFRTLHRTYLGESNILVTRFEGPEGTVRLTDLMPVFSEDEKRRHLSPEHEVLRILEGVAGEVEVELSFCPRPNYARRTTRLRSRR